jgi:hypothetical protein
MAFDQTSPSRDGHWDIEAIRQFWDSALKRLKAHAELLAASGVRPTTVTNPASTRQIDGDDKLP